MFLVKCSPLQARQAVHGQGNTHPSLCSYECCPGRSGAVGGGQPLVCMHARTDPQPHHHRCARPVNHRFDVGGECVRMPGSYVGLRNGGATCYMNAVLQQLFMQPHIRQLVLGARMMEAVEIGQDSMFHQLQVGGWGREGAKCLGGWVGGGWAARAQGGAAGAKRMHGRPWLATVHAGISTGLALVLHLLVAAVPLTVARQPMSPPPQPAHTCPPRAHPPRHWR